MLGGRTNHWGRYSFRFGPDDFHRRSIDGLGEDWPIGYDDLSPYYDRLDRFIGLFGSNEGLRNHPDGIFLPPPRPRCYELLVQEASRRLGIPCIPSRMSVLTRPHNGRPACHYCGQCNRGCRVNANFSSPGVFIEPALETGRLTLVTGAMAREVTLDPAGRATGVSYVNKATGADEHVRARVVVLAASACESARLLLNSRSSRFPDGLGNTGGAGGPLSHRHHRRRRVGRHPPRWWTTCRTTRTAPGARTSTCRGGWTTGSSTSPAATTSRSGAASPSRPTGSWVRSTSIPAAAATASS